MVRSDPVTQGIDCAVVNGPDANANPGPKVAEVELNELLTTVVAKLLSLMTMLPESVGIIAATALPAIKPDIKAAISIEVFFMENLLKNNLKCEI